MKVTENRQFAPCLCLELFTSQQAMGLCPALAGRCSGGSQGSWAGCSHAILSLQSRESKHPTSRGSTLARKTETGCPFFVCVCVGGFQCRSTGRAQVAASRASQGPLQVRETLEVPGTQTNLKGEEICAHQDKAVLCATHPVPALPVEGRAARLRPLQIAACRAALL